MKFQPRLISIFFIILLAACGDKETAGIKVTGELKNIDAMMAQYPGVFDSDSIRIFLYEMPFGSSAEPIQLDSTVVSNKDGKFTLEAQAAKQGLFDVLIEKGPMIPVINDADIHLEIDLTNENKYYTVSGSPATGTLRNFLFDYSERSVTTGKAFKKLDSLKMTGASDTIVIAATDEKNSSLESLNEFLEQSINKADNPLMAAFALGIASRSFSQGQYDSALTQTIQKYPTDANLQYLKNQLKEAEAVDTQSQAQTSWVGKAAPEMSMPDVNGSEVSLSSFRGKYVLVDFWASWCGPCRMENPNLVRAYNQFKNKNFTILGVSLDKEKENWVEAIEKDKLTWTHISDLAFWNSKSVDIFQFQGIPYNVLVDPDGMIIAEGLRGSELSKKLGEVLK